MIQEEAIQKSKTNDMINPQCEGLLFWKVINGKINSPELPRANLDTETV